MTRGRDVISAVITVMDLICEWRDHVTLSFINKETVNHVQEKDMLLPI